MTKQYRIIERLRFEAESDYTVQRTKRFLFFSWWSTYRVYSMYGDPFDKAFDTVAEARAYINEKAKRDRWEKGELERVVGVFQLNAEGELVEVDV